MSPQTKPIAAKLWSRVRKAGPGECWPWTGRVNGAGYGSIRVSKSKVEGAHRVAFALSNYKSIEGLDVCHRCDTKRCCNPSHLFPGTRLDNMADAVAKGRMSKGIERPLAKLSEPEIISIRKRYLTGGISQRQLAKDFGVSQSLISLIVSKKYWKHI